MMPIGNRTPLFRYLLFFCAGILVAFYFQTPDYPLICIACGIAVIFVIAQVFSGRFGGGYRFRWIAGILCSISIFFSGVVLTFLNEEKESPHHFRNAEDVEGWFAVVLQPLTETSSGYKTRLHIKCWMRDGQVHQGSGKCLAYFSGPKAKGLKYGDLIYFTSKPREVPRPANPAQLDYKAYLSLQKIYDQVVLEGSQWRRCGTGEGGRLQAFAFSLREKLLRVFARYTIRGQDYGVLSALILGFEEEIDQDTITAYAASGAMHILSVSGLHVGIIYLALNLLLGFLDSGRRKKILKAVILILFLWFYALLTGCSPSVMRSAAMLSFVLVGKLTRPNTSLFNTLSASAFVLLAVDPYLLFQVGFQLSFAAVAGILVLQPAIQNCFMPRFWLARHAWSIISVSLAAQLATFPLGLYYFHQFPVYFLLTNIIVIPLSSVIIYGGVLLLAASFWNGAASFLGWVVGSFVHAMNGTVAFIERMPFSVVNGISISGIETCLIYTIIVFLFTFLQVRKAVWLLFSVVTLALLIWLQLNESLNQWDRSRFVVYSIRGTSAWNILDGRSNYFLADTSASALGKALKYAVVPYWRENGFAPDQVAFLPGSSCDSGPLIRYRNFIRYGNFLIAIVGDSTDLPVKKKKVDLLIMFGNPKISVEKAARHFDFKRLVIDPSNSRSKAVAWVQEASALGLEVFSVQQQGAFVFSFASPGIQNRMWKHYDKTGAF